MSLPITKIVFIFNSTNTKQLEKDTNEVKNIIKNNDEVIKGPICFKHQRQIIAHVKFGRTIDRLMKFNPHKSVKVQVLTKSY